jgi:hypothetical protein
MKLGFPSTSVPSKVTGIGYMNTFLPAEIFPIDPSPALIWEGHNKKGLCTVYYHGVLWKSSAAEFIQ